MVARQTNAQSACQIYAIVEAGEGAVDLLPALLAGGSLPSVLIVPVTGAQLTASTVRPLVEIAQKRNCAALLLDDAALARTLRADGVHLSSGPNLSMRYDEARSILGAGAIVGIDVGTSRHLAMELGEAGADYVGFSPGGSAAALEPLDEDDPEDEGPRTLDELIAWWSEVFEVPCVAFADVSHDNIRAFVDDGADFVAIKVASIGTLADRLSGFAAVRKIVEA